MNTQIILTAKQIRNDILNDTFDPIVYLEFKKQYPKFYDMLTNKNMDEEMLEKLISGLSTNSINDKNAASEFSSFGAEKYVYPKFGKPSSKDLEKAKTTIDKLP